MPFYLFPLYLSLICFCVYPAQQGPHWICLFVCGSCTLTDELHLLLPLFLSIYNFSLFSHVSLISHPLLLQTVHSWPIFFFFYPRPYPHYDACCKSILHCCGYIVLQQYFIAHLQPASFSKIHNFFFLFLNYRTTVLENVMEQKM